MGMKPVPGMSDLGGMFAPPPHDLPEKEFTKLIIDYAHSRGWLAYHVPDSRRCEAGFPDLVLAKPERHGWGDGGAVVTPARVVFAELKVGKKRPTLLQNIWLATVRQAGLPAYVWRPENWPEIVAVLS